MQRFAFFVIVCITILSLVSCGIANQEISGEQSNFKQNFSIGNLVEAHQELLLEGPRALSGSEAGPPEPFIQSQEEMVLQVDSANASPLLEAIHADLVEAIIRSGATIQGSSAKDINPNPIANFSYSYGEGPFYGVINVWAFQGQGNTLILLSEITESNTQNR